MTCIAGNNQTVNDQCQGGVCIGTNLCAGVTCFAQGQCYQVGTCNYSTGVCSNPAQPNGTPCTDPSGMLFNTTCEGAVCVGTNLCTGVTCFSQGQCYQQGTCSYQSGNCSNPFQPAGTPCNDYSLMTGWHA